VAQITASPFKQAERVQNYSQAPQLLEMSPQPAFAVPEPPRGRRLTVSDLDPSPLRVADCAATSRIARAHQGFDLGFQAGPSQSSPPQHEQHVPRSFYSSRTSSSSFLTHGAFPPHPAERPRYYSAALTEADKDALLHGELNHNLKAWTPKDLVLHHESRKALVPRVGINKLDKIDAIAQIDQAVQQSQIAFNKKVRSSKLPTFRLTNEHGCKERMTYPAQASQSMYDLRSSSAPAPQLPPGSPVLPPIPMLSRKFSFEASPPLSRSTHVRAASSGDNYIRPTRPQRLQPPSSPSSNSSSRARSPLAPQDPLHQANPDATFDAFLVPHKSGKGEAYRGADNAKKPKGSKRSGTTTPDRNSSPATETSSPRRFLGKMPSLPRLRKRSSPRDVRKDEDEDVPEVPPLP
jgi:hypothetical protein